jgi:hypothetical protein
MEGTMPDCVATQISQRHHGWYVWKGKPVATRFVTRQRIPAEHDQIYALTVIGDSWRDLDEQLIEQDANDARYTMAAR